MAIKPILFNTEMVRAILDGRKTQTRRVVKLQPEYGEEVRLRTNRDGKLVAWFYCENPMLNPTVPSPWGGPEQEARYQPEDILWGRETWFKDAGRYMYRANYSDNEKFYVNGKEVSMKWCPSIHMPKEAARIFLRVTDAWVERLKSISEEDAIAEGADGPIHEMCFSAIWDSTIKHADLPRYGWDANPWVWVIEFERMEVSRWKMI